MKRKMLFEHYTIIFIVMLSSHLIVVFCHPSCGLYGANPCQFVPAPPGHTPSCARPGKTYCEHADNYPVYLIKHLVHKWGLEARNLIVDETPDEFNTLTIKHHDVSHFFDFFGPTANHLGGHFDGYKYDIPKTQTSHYNGYAEPIYIPKPGDRDRDTDYAIYTQLIAPSFNQRPVNNHGYQYGRKVSHYNPVEWLKRYSRDLNALKEKNDQKIMRTQNERISLNSTTNFNDGLNQEFIQNLFRTTDEQERHRVKRQSPGRSQLCQTNSQFITPQAALNSKGNWMYVVNEMNTARQLVKTEVCASTVCTNICQLPNGYNSRCEQKYVQKRLIALSSNGQNLYTDTFWFPSCCVCTLSNL